MMTCAQPSQHDAFSHAGGLESSGFPIKSTDSEDGWHVFSRQANSEDIRFTFSIWHRPEAYTEPVQRKTDQGYRTRSSVPSPVPFTWLPLLPLESPIQPTGIPLSSSPIDGDRAAAPSSLIRRGAVIDGEVEEQAMRVKKKQRLSTSDEEPERTPTVGDTRHLERTVIAQERKSVPGIAIHRVRMRDVDIVEDFLYKFLPEFGTGVPLRILLGTSGVAALAIQPGPQPANSHETPNPSSENNDTHVLDPTQPILALVLYRKTRSDLEMVTTHVQAIAVHPGSRRLGLGQQLVAEALKDSIHDVPGSEGWKRPKIRVKAEGYDDNGSREFWQRCVSGLRVSPRRIGFRRGWIGEAQLYL